MPLILSRVKYLCFKTRIRFYTNNISAFMKVARTASQRQVILSINASLL